MSFLSDERFDNLVTWERTLREANPTHWVQPLYAPLEVFRRHGHMLLFTGINPGVSEADAERRKKAGFIEKYKRAFLEFDKNAYKSTNYHTYLAGRHRDFWQDADAGWKPLTTHAQRLLSMFWEAVSDEHLSQIPAGNLHPFGTPAEQDNEQWREWLARGLELPCILQPMLWVIFGQAQGKSALRSLPGVNRLECCQDVPNDWKVAPKIQIFKITWSDDNTTWVVLVRHYNRMTNNVSTILKSKIANTRNCSKIHNIDNAFCRVLTEVYQHFADCSF